MLDPIETLDGGNDSWVELSPTGTAQFSNRFLSRPPLAERSVTNYRLKCIGGRHDASRKRNPYAGKAVGIALAIETLVMPPRRRREGLQPSTAFKKSCTLEDMRSQMEAILFGQFAYFVQERRR